MGHLQIVRRPFLTWCVRRTCCVCVQGEDRACVRIVHQKDITDQVVQPPT